MRIYIYVECLLGSLCEFAGWFESSSDALTRKYVFLRSGLFQCERFISSLPLTWTIIENKSESIKLLKLNTIYRIVKLIIQYINIDL